MLLAPLVTSAPRPGRRRHASPRPTGQTARPSTRRVAPVIALWGWLLIGACALLAVPALRGGPALGATVPFWLVGAPLLDLLWIHRARLGAAMRDVRRERLRIATRPVTRRRQRPTSPSGTSRL